MKKFIIIILFFLIGSCTLIEIIDVSERQQRIQLDSLYATSVDTTVVDTTKYPIGFDVSVEDWEDIEINF